MTLQDLKNNRDRIIRNIMNQSSEEAAISGVMNKMSSWLNSREDIKNMNPGKANIDKFTAMAITHWIKNDYKPVITDEWLTKRESAKWNSISW
jgi:hypothetical protein